MSLYALGNCLNAQAEDKIGVIPYRDSMLTRLMLEALSGEAQIALILNLKQQASKVRNTVDSLQWAYRPMATKNAAMRNIITKGDAKGLGGKSIKMGQKGWAAIKGAFERKNFPYPEIYAAVVQWRCQQRLSTLEAVMQQR